MAEQIDMISLQGVPHFILCQEFLKWYLSLKFSVCTAVWSWFSLGNVRCIMTLLGAGQYIGCGKVTSFFIWVYSYKKGS
jgi:hypothetical protein